MSDADIDLINEGSAAAKKADTLASLPTERLQLICDAHDRNAITGLRLRTLREELSKRTPA